MLDQSMKGKLKDIWGELRWSPLLVVVLALLIALAVVGGKPAGPNSELEQLRGESAALKARVSQLERDAQWERIFAQLDRIEAKVDRMNHYLDHLEEAEMGAYKRKG